MRAYVIVDLGFGDAGKGLLTDALVRKTGARLVVRYNGGAQAGHNVVTSDGCHHTFSQFGSGMFVPGVISYLSKYIVIHPSALVMEGEILKQKGVTDVFSRLYISDQALIVTPYHQAVNRIRELARGENRHGSCGVGIGEAVEDGFNFPEASIKAGDLLDSTTLRRKLEFIRQIKQEQVNNSCKGQLSDKEIAREWQLFERNDVADFWIHSIQPIIEHGLITSDSKLYELLRKSETTVFEGAQGILLDQDFGFHPYTTWSQCSAENALSILNDAASNTEVIKIGVTRSHAVRHGPGPLPTETHELVDYIFDHNQKNQWQGNVRYGWFDAVLTRYALRCARNIDYICVTHLDLLERLTSWKYCNQYQQEGNYSSLNFDGVLSRDQRQKITEKLFTAEPVYETCTPDKHNVVHQIERLTGKAIAITSSGPTAQQVKFEMPIF